MATQKQRRAARKNVRSAQRAARSKKTIARLPKETRRDLGRQAAKSRQRGGKPGRALEDRTRQDSTWWRRGRNRRAIEDG
jgi:hypothetical protein